MEDGARSTKYPVVALGDTQAVRVEGRDYWLVGRGKRNFYNGFREKRPAAPKNFVLFA